MVLQLCMRYEHYRNFECELRGMNSVEQMRRLTFARHVISSSILSYWMPFLSALVIPFPNLHGYSCSPDITHKSSSVKGQLPTAPEQSNDQYPEAEKSTFQPESHSCTLCV